MNMKRFGLLAFVLLMLVGGCEKNRTHERASVTFPGKAGFIPLNSLIPELDGLEVHDFAYCLGTEPMVFDTTYTTGRIWLPAHTQTNTVILPAFTIPSPFEEGIETQVQHTFTVTVPDFQWEGEILDVDSGLAEGIVTLHFSYPEDFPFERIYLQAAYIELPGFVSVELAEDEVIRIDKRAVNVWSDWEIPRSGRDLPLTVFSLATRSREEQENGRYSIRGDLTCNLTVSVKPEDAVGDVSGTWEQVPLEITFINSEIDITRATVQVAQPDPDQETIRRSAPFPALQDDRLNHFSLVQVLMTYDSDEFITTYGVREFIGQGWEVSLFSSRGAAERSISLGESYPGDHFYMQERDASHSVNVVKDLNSLVADPYPDVLGFTVKHKSRTDLWESRRTYHRKYTVEWRIPLRLTGVNWQKEIETEPIPISANDMESYPGSVIHVGFALLLSQPFDITGYPVVIDADGKHHELKDKSFEVKGGSNFAPTRFLSDFDWTAEDPARRIQVYFKLTLGTCSYNAITPDQGIEYRLTYVNKELLPGK